MRAEIELTRNLGCHWAIRDTGGARAYVKGQAFYHGEHHNASRLAEMLAGAAVESGLESLTSVVAQLNGSFAVVCQAGEGVYACVDIVRSIPVFYSIESGGLSVGDNPYRLAARSGDEAPDPLSRAEFLRSGYTVGKRTLAPSVSQLLAGEYLLADAEGVSTGRYADHLRGEAEKSAPADRYDALDALSENVFGRLVESVEGRPIVVPLSGGYDSRYILAMLRKTGYENVMCYTYGRKGSYEHQIAGRVAAELDYDWKFVEYDDARWRSVFESPGFREYAIQSFNLSSLPHIQEFGAVQGLHAEGSIPDGSVFVPGFCGDLFAGSYVPTNIKDGHSTTLMQRGVDALINSRDFGLGNDVPGWENDILKDIASYRDGLGCEVETLDDFVSVNEAWFTDHKVSKFVVNAVRAYEHFGYEWRMPLWDRELVDYWYRVPLALRLHDPLYERHLFDRVFDPLKIGFRKPRAVMGHPVFRALKRVVPAQALAGARRVVHRALRNRPSRDVSASSPLYDIIYDDLTARGAKPRKTSHRDQILSAWMVDKVDSEWPSLLGYDD